MAKLNQLLVLAVLFFSTLTASSQREVATSAFVPPTPKDIVIAGKELAKDVTCTNGNSVYLQGEHNEVQVHGTCGSVRVKGNRNFVWVDHFTTVPVEGNDNVIFVSDTRTQYSSAGDGNRFERSKH